jgi:hypothetical protein
LIAATGNGTVGSAKPNAANVGGNGARASIGGLLSRGTVSEAA